MCTNLCGFFLLLLSFLSNHLFIFVFFIYLNGFFWVGGVVCLRVEGQLTLCAPYPPKNIQIVFWSVVLFVSELLTLTCLKYKCELIFTALFQTRTHCSIQTNRVCLSVWVCWKIQAHTLRWEEPNLSQLRVCQFPKYSGQDLSVSFSRRHFDKKPVFTEAPGGQWG